jgi:hypothetical protein
VPGSEHAYATFVGRDYHWNAWSRLKHSVRTGDLSDPAASWLDLQMLVMLGGRERTEQEYAGAQRTRRSLCPNDRFSSSPSIEGSLRRRRIRCRRFVVTQP